MREKVLVPWQRTRFVILKWITTCTSPGFESENEECISLVCSEDIFPRAGQKESLFISTLRCAALLFVSHKKEKWCVVLRCSFLPTLVLWSSNHWALFLSRAIGQLQLISAQWSVISQVLLL